MLWPLGPLHAATMTSGKHSALRHSPMQIHAPKKDAFLLAVNLAALCLEAWCEHCAPSVRYMMGVFFAALVGLARGGCPCGPTLPGTLLLLTVVVSVDVSSFPALCTTLCTQGFVKQSQLGIEHCTASHSVRQQRSLHRGHVSMSTGWCRVL